MSKKHLIMTVLVVCLLAGYAFKFLGSSPNEGSEQEPEKERTVVDNTTSDVSVANKVSEILDLRIKKKARENGRTVAKAYVDAITSLTKKCWMMNENINMNAAIKEIKDTAARAKIGISLGRPTVSRVKDSPIHVVKVSFRFTDAVGKNASSIPYKDLARFMMEVDRLPHKYEWSNLRISLDSRDKTKVRVSTAILTTRMIDKKVVAIIRKIKNNLR